MLHTGEKTSYPSVIGLCLLLLCGVGACGSLARAAQPVLGGAEAVITQADARGRDRDAEAAVALLSAAVERYPTYARLYQSLAFWQEFRGLTRLQLEGLPTYEKRQADFRTHLTSKDYALIAREVFETYGQATMFVPDLTEIQPQLASLLSEQFPVELGEYGPLALPGEPTPFIFRLSDSTLEARFRGQQQGLMTLQPLPVTPAYLHDPKSLRSARQRWTFSWMLLAYAYDPDETAWRLRFRVIWQASPDAPTHIARVKLARTVADFMLRLSAVTRAYSGERFTPLFSNDGAINVWLCEEGQAGGEAYDNNIYIYDLGNPDRTPLEWVRELIHEYGHQVIPAIGGYTQPEWAANGRLGERLFLRWLLANPEPRPEGHPWLQDLDAPRLLEERVTALTRHFAEVGPEMPLMRGTDLPAMDGFIGMALYLEATRGGVALADILQGVKSPTYGGPQGFLATVEAQEYYQQSSERPIIALRVRGLPDKLPLRVYLREGTWRGQLESVLGTAVPMARIDCDGKVVKADPAGGFTLTNVTQGWHRLVLSGEGDVPLGLSTIRLVKQ